MIVAIAVGDAIGERRIGRSVIVRSCGFSIERPLQPCDARNRVDTAPARMSRNRTRRRACGVIDARMGMAESGIRGIAFRGSQIAGMRVRRGFVTGNQTRSRTARIRTRLRSRNTVRISGAADMGLKIGIGRLIDPSVVMRQRRIGRG